jgi:uncharacterized protein (TIGR02284 family)
MSDAVPTADEAILTDLAHKLVDQVALYGMARDVALGPKTIDAIQRAKQARAGLLQEINAKIWLQESPSIAQGEKLGTAEKAFKRLRDLTSKNDLAAIAEVERGEDYLRDRISKRIADDRLTAHTRNYLQTVLSRIETTHDEISKLKHALQAGA